VVPRRRTADLKLADLREELKRRELLETAAAAQPIAQFRAWLYEACCAGLAEPNAMTLATVGPDGQPSARIVSLSQVTNEGFTFFTNYRSAKGRELAEHPHAALVFHWPEIGRQVRINGAVEKTARGEVEAYFEMNSREAQLGAWASWQSSEIADRGYLDARVTKLDERYGPAEIPTPASWGGYRLRPESMEFWQSRANHLHDRLRYTRQANGLWIIDRLAP
jgi:pyridoxamine 5'-phosphate oxidase